MAVYLVYVQTASPDSFILAGHDCIQNDFWKCGQQRKPHNMSDPGHIWRWSEMCFQSAQRQIPLSPNPMVNIESAMEDNPEKNCVWKVTLR